MHIVDTIEQISLATIKASSRNARRHSAKQIEHLKAIIERVGFVQPALVDQDNQLIAGHGRLTAARQLGMTHMPVIRLAHLREAELRALALADNRIAELASWDDDALRLELSELITEELDFSISDLTGFESPQIDALVFGSDFGADADDEPPPTPKAAVTVEGDIWRAEGLTLVCGDATALRSYAALKGSRAAMVLTDPPYNQPIIGHVSGKGKVRHREFVQGSGEWTEEEFIAFLTAVYERIGAHTLDGALLYVFMDGAHLFEALSAGRAAGLYQKAFLTWAKTNAGMGSLYRSQTEHIIVFKNGRAPHANNVQLGRYGRNRTTLWTYAGANCFGADRDAALSLHPTAKTVALLKDAILDASGRGDIVLDPFAGSGSTLIAAHRTKRRAFGIELDPLYLDGALARLTKVCGVEFRRESDGALWADLAGGPNHD